MGKTPRTIVRDFIFCLNSLRSRRSMSHQLSIIEQRIQWTRFQRASDKAVLSALARWYAWRSDGTNVRPWNAELAAKSQVPLRTVERALERLVDDGWLEVTERHNRGRTTYRIVLERLATADPEALKIVADRDESTAKVAVESGFDRQSGGRNGSGGRENGPDFEKVAVENHVLPVRTSTSTSSSSDQDRQSGGRTETVLRFLDWWTDTYPRHNHGAQSRLSLEYDGALVADLLRARPLERLQAMALQLWQVVADANPKSDRSWIAGSNRSLHVLRVKADFLDRAVSVPVQLTLGPIEEAPLSRRELDDARLIRTRAYGGCPHEPRCAREVDCVREIALSRRVAAC